MWLVTAGTASLSDCEAPVFRIESVRVHLVTCGAQFVLRRLEQASAHADVRIVAVEAGSFGGRSMTMRSARVLELLRVATATKLWHRLLETPRHGASVAVVTAQALARAHGTVHGLRVRVSDPLGQLLVAL
jgi:hypothetical protein